MENERAKVREDFPLKFIFIFKLAKRKKLCVEKEMRARLIKLQNSLILIYEMSYDFCDKKEKKEREGG